MIKKLQINSGFLFDLPNIGNREFIFEPDINILYGPNGCGKTSIMKVMAGYASIPTKDKMYFGGWSRSNSSSNNYPQGFKNTTYGEIDAVIDWDGTPCFLNSAAHDSSHNIGYFVDHISPDGLMSMQDQISLIIGHMSDGELRLNKISKLVKELLENKNFKWKLNNKTVLKEEKNFNKYIKSLPCNGKPTLFLDEPDKSLNIKNQINFWTKFIFNLSETYQVIISTHSLIPLLIPKFKQINVINIVPDYYENSFKEIQVLLECKKLIEESNANVK
jgi:predicted ATPase